MGFEIYIMATSWFGLAHSDSEINSYHNFFCVVNIIHVYHPGIQMVSKFKMAGV